MPVEVRRRTTNLPDILTPLSTLQACLRLNTELLLVSRKNINLQTPTSTTTSKSNLYWWRRKGYLSSKIQPNNDINPLDSLGICPQTNI